MKNTALQFRAISATDALRTAVMALQQAKIETASLDARLLLQHVLGLNREQWLAAGKVALNTEQYAAYRELIDKRANRQPLAQLTGKREFWDLTFKVSAATLDPRPDSETLIEAVLAKCEDKNRALRVLDMGTGTGCLLLTLLKHLPSASGVGVDISRQALDVACENAVNLGLAARAKFMQSCWNEQVEGVFDIVISNPPYIPTKTIATLAPEVRCFEPMLALDGGEDGLDCYRTICAQLPLLLVPGGIAAFEIGMGQQRDVENIATDCGLQVVEVRKDMAGIPRCVMVQNN